MREESTVELTVLVTVIEASFISSFDFHNTSMVNFTLAEPQPFRHIDNWQKKWKGHHQHNCWNSFYWISIFPYFILAIINMSSQAEEKAQWVAVWGLEFGSPAPCTAEEAHIWNPSVRLGRHMDSQSSDAASLDKLVSSTQHQLWPPHMDAYTYTYPYKHVHIPHTRSL